MKILLISFLTLSLFSFVFIANDWVAPEKVKKLENPVEVSEKSLKTAKKIYKKMCWSCHGTNGMGDGPAASSLSPLPADFSTLNFQNQKDGEIFWKLSTGKGTMVPYENTLTEKQRWSLVNYLRIISK